MDTDLAAMSKAWHTNWPRIVAKAWADPTFHKRLLADPAAAVAAEGLPIIPGLHIKIDAGATSPTLTLPLPTKPAGLAEDDVVKIASAGVANAGSCSQTCCC